MKRQFFRYLVRKWCGKKGISSEKTKKMSQNDTAEHVFSPMEYENPCIFQMCLIIKHIIKERRIPYQKLELIIIDAEKEEDNDDIRNVLSQCFDGLNYLLLVTDRPEYFEDYIYMVYDETGLIVQQMPKSGRRHARGNLVLDFERSGSFSAEGMIRPEIIYLPVYKKPWEISENLDIIVPVGYNTLVVNGIFSSQPEECCSMNERFMSGKIDRLDHEFRKG